ncbi:MAG: hypothetical protein E7277_00110 [Lachnospiraceae bacterium]|jgi:hypothetical protein|nr:hypothetical protein [Lachnospiraceae bacterium]
MRGIIKVKKQELATMAIAVLLFHLSIVKINEAYFRNYPRMQLGIVIVLTAYLLLHLRCLFLKKNILFNIVVLMFGMGMFITIYRNMRVFPNSFRSGMLTIFQYMMVLLVMECLHESGNIVAVVKTFYYCALFYCVLADFHAVLTGAKYIGVIGTYLVGNKFSIAYLHIYTLCFFYFLWQRKGRSYLLLIAHYAVAVLICIYSQCTTGLLGCAILLIAHVVRPLGAKLIKKVPVAYGLLLLATFVLLIFSEIVKWKPIRFVIEEVLNEDITLTGRMGGFVNIHRPLLLDPIWGVSPLNNYIISRRYVGMDDLQNGMADMMLSYGLVGVSLLLILIALCMRKGNVKQGYGFYAMMYMFIALAAVEVTLNLKFVVVLSLVAFAWDKKEENRLIR